MFAWTEAILTIEPFLFGIISGRTSRAVSQAALNQHQRHLATVARSFYRICVWVSPSVVHQARNEPNLFREASHQLFRSSTEQTFLYKEKLVIWFSLLRRPFFPSSNQWTRRLPLPGHFSTIADPIPRPPPVTRIFSLSSLPATLYPIVYFSFWSASARAASRIFQHHQTDNQIKTRNTSRYWISPIGGTPKYFPPAL